MMIGGSGSQDSAHAAQPQGFLVSVITAQKVREGFASKAPSLKLCWLLVGVFSLLNVEFHIQG